MSALEKPILQSKKSNKKIKIINKIRRRRLLIKKKTNRQTCHMSISTADGIHCENSSCKAFLCISHSMFSLKHGSLNELERNFLFV